MPNRQVRQWPPRVMADVKAHVQQATITPHIIPYIKDSGKIHVPPWQDLSDLWDESLTRHLHWTHSKIAIFLHLKCWRLFICSFLSWFCRNTKHSEVWTRSFRMNNAVRQMAFLFLFCRLGLENVLILPLYMCVQHHSYFPHVLSCFTRDDFTRKCPAPSILPCEKCTVHFSGSRFTLYWSKLTIFSMVVRTEWFVGATSLISRWFISGRIKL